MHRILPLLLLAACAKHPTFEPTGAPHAVRLAHGFVNVWALVGDEGVVLVDAHYPGKTDRLLRDLDKEGIAADDVTLILLTHGHADHAGSAAALREALGVPVAVGEGDVHLLEAGHNDPLVPTGGTGRLLKPFIGKEYPAFQPDIVVREPLDLSPWGLDARAVPVGGHTAGSLFVTLPDGRVVCGDLVRGGFTAHHRPTVHFFHDDLPAAHAAVGALLDDGATAMLPGHGDVLAAEDVAAWLAGMQPAE